MLHKRLGRAAVISLFRQSSPRRANHESDNILRHLRGSYTATGRHRALSALAETFVDAYSTQRSLSAIEFVRFLNQPLFIYWFRNAPGFRPSETLRQITMCCGENAAVSLKIPPSVDGMWLGVIQVGLERQASVCDGT